jgi:hypothetical protein
MLLITGITEAKNNFEFGIMVFPLEPILVKTHCARQITVIRTLVRCCLKTGQSAHATVETRLILRNECFRFGQCGALA